MVNSYDVAILSEKVAYLEAALKSAGIELPAVTSEDNGATLQVVAGAWAKGLKLPELPTVTSDDNGKALQVLNGVWATGANLMPEVIEGFSFNATNVNTEGTYVNAYKIGKLIIISIVALVCKIDLTGAAEIITGLPKPITNTVSICWGETASGPVPIRLRASADDNNGKILVWYEDVMKAGKSIVGTVIYIAE